MVNLQILRGNWNEVKGRLRQRWGQLTENDLQEFQGGTEQLVGMIQEKTGESRESVERYLDELTGGVSGAAESGMQTARHYRDRWAEASRRATDELSRQTQEGYAQAERMIRQRPGQTVGAAFGIGMIAGVVLGLALRSGR